MRVVRQELFAPANSSLSEFNMIITQMNAGTKEKVKAVRPKHHDYYKWKPNNACWWERDRSKLWVHLFQWTKVWMWSLRRRMRR